MTTTTATRALLTDGRVVSVRRLGPADVDAAVRLHAGLPERDQYTRFFTPHPGGLDRLLRRIIAEGNALGAYLGDELVGMASFAALAASTEDREPGEAEVAFAVDHARQAHGVGTLLLEHLASAARGIGVSRFVAEVLAENTAMLRVFRDSGFPMTTRSLGSTCLVTLELVPGYLAEVGERERLAEVASLTALLRPASVAVVGASRRRDAIGNAVLRNLIAGGFTGACYPVNPHATEIEGLPAVASVSELPLGLDLALVCVPAEAVPLVAQDCGRRGVRALVVITSGLTGRPELAGPLLDAVRRYGMRLVGPNCLGIVNTDARVRLSATFAHASAPAGRVGVVTQSGGMAIALLAQLATLGLGVSTMVSTGDKYDVSGNDLLMWWRRDDATDLAVLYLESFGNPRKFGRLARALAQRKPVLTIRTGSSTVAQRAAASHTAAAATPAATRDALFGQAGVIAVDTMTELIAVIATLSWQPLPAGGRVAVVSNAGGAGVLAADACVARGLTLPAFTDGTLARLRGLLPPTSSLINPVDTTAGVDAETFGRCLRTVADDPNVDAVIALAAQTAVTDPVAGILAAAGPKPVLAVGVGQLATVRPLGSAAGGTVVPLFADPAVAAGALAAVAGYGRWRARPAGAAADPPGVDVERARAVLADHLTSHPDGGWLPASLVSELLHCFGLPIVDAVPVPDADAAVWAANGVGYPVALKAVAAGVLHKSRAGGVALGLRDATEVRAAFATFTERFGAALSGALVQPMVEPGRELLVGVHGDPTFGPLVVLGLGGVDTDLVADRAGRLVPLTEADAADLVGSLRASPLLFGDAGLDPAELVDVLLRVARMADSLPEIAEADLNPVVLAARSARVLDARVRIEPVRPVDPYLRRLRT